MLIIKAIKTTLADGTEMLAPETDIPHDKIYSLCDGENYTVYEPGDTLPDSRS